MLLGAAVLVIAVLALRDPKSHVTAGPPSASTAAASASKTSVSSSSGSSKKSAGKSSAGDSSASSASVTATGVKSVPLVVLNNSETSGLAKRAANEFRDGGWTVSSTGNLSNNIVSTCAYYDPDVAGSKAAARALADQFPTIRRVKERFAELPSGPVVVVLTPGYSPG